jgi:hypothetical protein
MDLEQNAVEMKSGLEPKAAETRFRGSLCSWLVP